MTEKILFAEECRRESSMLTSEGAGFGFKTGSKYLPNGNAKTYRKLAKAAVQKNILAAKQ